jgi:hypothetical protein
LPVLTCISPSPCSSWDDFPATWTSEHDAPHPASACQVSVGHMGVRYCCWVSGIKTPPLGSTCPTLKEFTSSWMTAPLLTWYHQKVPPSHLSMAHKRATSVMVRADLMKPSEGHLPAPWQMVTTITSLLSQTVAQCAATFFQVLFLIISHFYAVPLLRSLTHV